MQSEDIQFLYVALVLPSLFGFTMIGEGLHKVLRAEKIGWVSLVAGCLFVLLVIGSYLFLSGRLEMIR